MECGEKRRVNDASGQKPAWPDMEEAQHWELPLPLASISASSRSEAKTAGERSRPWPGEAVIGDHSPQSCEPSSPAAAALVSLPFHPPFPSGENPRRVDAGARTQRLPIRSHSQAQRFQSHRSPKQSLRPPLKTRRPHPGSSDRCFRSTMKTSVHLGQ